eukprot:COSAG02_NODE_472_length_21636_cov_767.911366_17_plen_281_part_00
MENCLGDVFRDDDILEAVLECGGLSLWHVSCVGVTVCKSWERCVRRCFGAQLATPGRDVLLLLPDASSSSQPCDGKMALTQQRELMCRVVVPTDEEVRDMQRGTGHFKVLINPEGKWRGGTSFRSYCYARVSELRFVTKVCPPAIESEVRNIVQAQELKAAHMKHMTVVALQPCLPFTCHRCHARPEIVDEAHPQGRPERGRKRWFSALQEPSSLSMRLECWDCLVLATAEDKGVRRGDVEAGEFVWRRCMPTLDFFARRKQMGTRGTMERYGYGGGDYD